VPRKPKKASRVVLAKAAAGRSQKIAGRLVVSSQPEAVAPPRNRFEVEMDQAFERVLEEASLEAFAGGKSRLDTKSAFVTYTNEFFGGRTNALKIQFFTQPIGEEAQAKLLNRDNREISRGGYATLVLFLDERDQISQANLTYVIPGTPVVRTVGASREELSKYFSLTTTSIEAVCN
jgi:hypothetical protein